MDEPGEDEKRRMAGRAAAVEAKYAKQAASHASVPDAVPSVRVNDEGAEASMAVADSNALRASLGLKPLQSSASADDVARAEHRRHMDSKRAKEKQQEAKALEERLAQKNEQRRLDAKLKKTRGLGQASGQEDDDVLVRNAAAPEWGTDITGHSTPALGWPCLTLGTSSDAHCV
jgi:hypothetical protein